MPIHRLPLALCLVAILAGCGDPEPVRDQHAAEVARLADAFEDLAASNAELQMEVRRQSRRIDALSRDAAIADSAASVAAATGGLGSGDLAAEGARGPQPLTTADGQPGESEEDGVVGTLLATEKGQKALQQAAAKELAKSEALERRTFVSYSIGVFARKAGLADRQTEELQAIWKRSMDDGVKLREDFAKMRELPEAERPAAREKAMEFMRELGRTRNEQVADLLTQEQMALYEATETEIVAGLHGGPRRPAATESKEARASED